MILLETTQSLHLFRSLSAILAIGGDDSMASRVAHLGLGNISGRLAMLAAIRRAGLIASELGPRQRLAAHGEKMLTYKAEQRLGTGKR
jgi:hypothetical protein